MSSSPHPRIFSPVPPRSLAHERGVEDGPAAALPSPGANAPDLAVARLAAIVESSDEAITSRTLDGIITTWNHGATRLYGYSEEEALGQCCLELIVPLEFRVQEEQALARVARGERVPPFETQRRHKSDVTVEVSVSVSPITDATGAVVAASSISHDIAGSKQAELTRMRLAAIVDASADAIISKDLNRIVTSWNPAAERIFGYTAGEIIGHPCVRLVPPDLDAEELEAFARVCSGERVEAFDTVRITRDGRRIDVSISAAPIKDAAGQVVGAAKVVRDITERKQTEALRRAKAEAERANLAKSEFLSRTSHELRTPMNAILGFGQLLEMERDLEARPRECVDQILSAGRHLLVLIDEVLDISNAEAGRIPLSLSPVAVTSLVQETWALVQPLGASHQINLPPPALPPGPGEMVLADPQRLKQVLINLLANAIKYNRPGGGVTLTCTRTGERAAEPGTPAALRFCVEDNGPGLSAEHIARLFTPFERLDAERTRPEVVGTGLGLALSKRMVELMGGTLGVHSVLGQGSSFWLELPLAPPDATGTPQA